MSDLLEVCEPQMTENSKRDHSDDSMSEIETRPEPKKKVNIYTPSANRPPPLQVNSVLHQSENFLYCISGRSRGGARGPAPSLFWVKNEEMTEGSKSQQGK